jgi:thiol-disulfide isomerase/thioredoxin
MIAALRLAALGVLSVFAVAAAGPSELLDLTEKEHRRLLEENRGQVVLFDFWATWCAPCRAEMPLLVQMERRLRARGFRLITVSADEPGARQEALALLREHGVAAPAFIKSVDDDDAFINAIHPKWSGALPALFLYDRHGRLARMFIGESEISEIEAAVKALL